MSRPAEEPRKPKRTRPSLPDAGHPAIDDDDDDRAQDLGPSTFRPNPARAGAPKPPVDETGLDEVLPGRAGAKKPTGEGKARTGSKKEPTPVTGGPNLVERIVFGRVGTGHLAVFCRQFGSYMNAGVPITRSLDSLQKQFARTALGPVLERVSLSVRRGDSLSDAMKREPDAFDAQFIAMISVAEARGGIPEVMKRMGIGYEKRQSLIRQARSALIYPTILIVVALAVGFLLTIFVLPKLVGILTDMLQGKNISMPLPTRMLISFNEFIIRFGWFVVPIGAIGTVFGLIWFYRRPRGKAMMDEAALWVPVLGKLLRMIDTARFGRVLSTLLDAGVDIGTSLDLTADTMTLVPYRRAITRTREAVMEGSEIADALRDTHRFPEDTLAIVNAGEETGKLPESLDRMAADYEERIEVMVKSLGSLIQPVIIILGGAIVLFILLAFMLAYVQILTSF